MTHYYRCLCPVFIVTLLGFAGCRTSLMDANNRLHHISSDLHGAYQPLYPANSTINYDQPWENRVTDGTVLSRNAQLYSQYQALLDDIEEAMLASSVADQTSTGNRQPVRVLIWLHGGLNNPSVNDRRLAENKTFPAQDGFREKIKAAGYYPLFISWRSGAWVSVADRYNKVRNGGLAQGPFAYIRGGAYLTTDFLTGVAQLPETLWDGGAEKIGEIDRDRQYGLLNRDKNDARWVDCFKSEDGLPGSAIASWGANNQNFSGGEALFYHTKHVVPGVVRIATTPMTQGLATPAWQMMLRRSKNLMVMEADALALEDGYGVTSENESIAAKEFAGNGVVAVLARRLEVLDRRLKKEGRTLEIYLYGHSMGAIVANELVENFPDLPYSRIVHMAAADSVRNWLDKTAPYLETHPNVNFYNLVLHPVNEEREDTSTVSLIPEGSLLVWLDSMLTKPDHVLDRRSGRWDNAKYLLPTYAKLNRLADGSRRPGEIKLKVFGLNDSVPQTPSTHGDFSEKEFWRPEFFWYAKDR